MKVLVRYFQEVGHPAASVTAALGRLPQSWLPEAVQASNGHALNLVERVGFTAGSRRLDVQVQLGVMEPHQVGDTTYVSIDWQPVSNNPMLPSLEGDIEVSPLGPTSCQLALSARYSPPLGWAGGLADRALMRRIAEATVKDFVDRVALGVAAALDEE